MRPGPGLGDLPCRALRERAAGGPVDETDGVARVSPGVWRAGGQAGAGYCRGCCECLYGVPNLQVLTVDDGLRRR